MVSPGGSEQCGGRLKSPPAHPPKRKGVSQKEFLGCANELTTCFARRYPPGDESPGYEAAPNELGFLPGSYAGFQAGFIRRCWGSRDRPCRRSLRCRLIKSSFLDSHTPTFPEAMREPEKGQVHKQHFRETDSGQRLLRQPPQENE
jgi:hypothetical protein